MSPLCDRFNDPISHCSSLTAQLLTKSIGIFVQQLLWCPLQHFPHASYQREKLLSPLNPVAVAVHHLMSILWLKKHLNTFIFVIPTDNKSEQLAAEYNFWNFENYFISLILTCCPNHGAMYLLHHPMQQISTTNTDIVIKSLYRWIQSRSQKIEDSVGYPNQTAHQT